MQKDNMQKYTVKNKRWQVPEFVYKEFFSKKSKYCYCIHVINEGDRIRKFLTKAKKASKKFDIIIADGGSTDGSLAFGFLKKVGVRTLLEKAGPGKLSAQTRMALAYAMEQGYEGIIFSDGNNKDDPNDTFKFAKRLDEGYDHIQGSRFIKGGRAVRTPFVRYWGIRLIHAPMISIGSGKWQTDTTNGFKAYSRKMIMDPKVNPFRNILSEYEIHYYLATRPAKLGYKYTEVPVTRSYPKSGKTPTKISPIKGMIKLNVSTFNACIGKYDPKR